ncbi:sensor histidine kinase [Paenibacillus donghaensis]|nr:histidine kinase [Paenibacillus donghaensis]
MIFFVILMAGFTSTEPNRRLVLYILIYVALNTMISLAADGRVHRWLICVNLLYLLGCMRYIDPQFALLLPLGLCELAALPHLSARQGVYILFALPVPALFISSPLLVFYSCAAALTVLSYLLLRRQSIRSGKQDAELERMRRELESLVLKHSTNHELLKASEYTAKLEERNRLAQEIHDGLGHAMTGALIQMEAAKLLLHSDAPKAERLLQNAIGISKQGIEEIRLTLKNNKPAPQQLGLNRLKAAVEDFGGRTGLMTSLTHEGDMERISPLHWRIIQENVTEALTNSAKYAGSSAVHVRISVLGHYVQAVVSDRGQGAPRIVKGLGLIGMEERAAALGGTVIADGHEGFTVTTLLPYGKR